MADANQVVLSIKVDEGDSEKRLAQLVLDIEATKRAQTELAKAREAGKVSSEQYAQQTVKLTNQLTLQQAEQRSLTKELNQVPPALAKVTPVAQEASAALQGAATKGLGLFSSQTDKATGLLGKFSTGTNLVTKGLAALQPAGETGALGLKAVAGGFAAIGIGVILLAFQALVSYFTQTNEGSKLLKVGLAALGAVVTTLSNLIFGVGKGLVEAFKNPRQALSDFVDFLKSQVANRLAAFGVILEGLQKHDFKQVANGVLQLNTGITNGIDKVKAYAAAVGTAAVNAGNLEAQQQKLKKSRAELEVSEVAEKGRVEELIRLSKDRTLSIGDRLNKLREAGKLENELSAKSQAQTKAELALIQQRNAAKGLSKTSDEIQEERDKRKELAQTEVDRKNILATIKARQSKFILEEAAERKQADTKALEARLKLTRDELALDTQQVEQRLRVVQQGSDEELALLQHKLENARLAELAVKNLTVAQARAIDAKYENESLALTLDFQRRKLLAALQAQADLTAAELAGQQAGSAEALRLQAQQIEQQRQLTLAGLAANADNTAAIAKTNAQAAQQQRQLEYQQVAQALMDDIERRKLLVENAHAAGLLKERAYQEKLAELTKIGTDAQTLINQDYRQDNAANQKQADANETAAITRHTADVKKGEETKQEIREATVQAFEQGTDAIITLFGEESAAGQAATAFKKVLALAEVGINLEKQLSLNAIAAAEIKAIPIIGPALGTAYEIAEDALAIAAAAASTAKILSFAQGGIAYGPSHAQGGIPLYHRGQAAGIEIEGGEPVLTRQVSQSPLLLGMASAINQLAGGRALVPTAALFPRFALGGLAQQPLLLDQLRGNAGAGIDYDRLAQATARALRHSPPITRISDVKAGLARDAQTQALSSS